MTLCPTLTPTEIAALVLYCPACEWLGYGKQALVREDEVARCPQCGGGLHRAQAESPAEQPLARLVLRLGRGWRPGRRPSPN